MKDSFCMLCYVLYCIAVADTMVQSNILKSSEVVTKGTTTSPAAMSFQPSRFAWCILLFSAFCLLVICNSKIIKIEQFVYKGTNAVQRHLWQ